MLVELWRWWTESWHAPRRARWLYAALALGFGAIGVAAAVAGDAAVAAIAGLVALATAALAALAPRLAKWTNAQEETSFDGR